MAEVHSILHELVGVGHELVDGNRTFDQGTLAGVAAAVVSIT